MKQGKVDPMAYDNAPKVQLCRIYKKTSKSGNEYFTGRLGGAKIAVLKSREVADDGGEIWNVILEPTSEKRVEAGNGKPSSFAEQRGLATDGARGGMTDDEIPF